AAEICRLGKCDCSMFHLYPDNLEPHVGSNLKENWIVEVEGGAEQRLPIGKANGLMQAIHVSSKEAIYFN
ncbi:MAG: hypothetical protein ABI072_00440, partial [Edaphobacter sp.]